VPLVPGLACLFACQLAGEIVSRGLDVPVPGPVLGFLLLAVALVAVPGLRAMVAPPANGLLRHLSLLFVPAAVGVMQQVAVLRAEGLAIAAALLVSTWAAMVVTALTFRTLARRFGGTALEAPGQQMPDET
jgi:holin-like protein